MSRRADIAHRPIWPVNRLAPVVQFEVLPICGDARRDWVGPADPLKLG